MRFRRKPQKTAWSEWYETTRHSVYVEGKMQRSPGVIGPMLITIGCDKCGATVQTMDDDTGRMPTLGAECAAPG